MAILKEADLYDGPEVADADIVSVYLIFNGELGMSTGKTAGQGFHCGWMLADFWVDLNSRADWEMLSTERSMTAWIDQHRRIVVRLAETPHVFQRVCQECDGLLMRDGGLTEVPEGAATAFVTVPYRRDSIPKILTHKKCQLL